MNKFLKTLALSAVVLFAWTTTPGQAQESKWFDMESCALCSCMKDHVDIMKDMKWSVHKISNGGMMVHMIPEKHKATMKKAHEKMMAKVAKLEQGKTMELCAFCQGYGGLKMAGANIEEMETVSGSVTLITSDDEEMVKKIQGFVMRAKAEHEKVMKAMAKSDK